MANFVRHKSGTKKIGVNLDLIVAYDFTEEKEKEPILEIAFAAPGPEGSIYKREYKGKEARALNRYLDDVALDITPRRSLLQE